MQAPFACSGFTSLVPVSLCWFGQCLCDVHQGCMREQPSNICGVKGWGVGGQVGLAIASSLLT